MSSLDNSMSHEGEKRRNYTMEFKREAIEDAEKNSKHKATEKFRVAVKRIREWRQNKLKILNQQLSQIIKDWKVVGENY